MPSDLVVFISSGEEIYATCESTVEPLTSARKAIAEGARIKAGSTIFSEEISGCQPFRQGKFIADKRCSPTADSRDRIVRPSRAIFLSWEEPDRGEATPGQEGL